MSDRHCDIGGIHLLVHPPDGEMAVRERAGQWLAEQGLIEQVEFAGTLDAAGRPVLALRLAPDYAEQWTPQADTLGLCERAELDTQRSDADLEREITVAMLAGPCPFAYPSVDELSSSIRIRRNIVQAARRTALAFDTRGVERPPDCWAYDDERGFTIIPGCSLITALTKATQPEVSGTLYPFSCYRATEYVTLLGIAQELADSNPELLARLQRQFEMRAIKSGQFHDVFLREYGSMEAPLPMRYFVPGDRTWFRNPDQASSDAEGYEGSWVFYLGGGLFSNFWKRDKPFTLTSKCVEVFHWRHGLYTDAEGDARIDEQIVEAHVRDSMNDPAALERILPLMMRPREPKGVYRDGGCIDTTREYPRWIRKPTSDMALPDA